MAFRSFDRILNLALPLLLVLLAVGYDCTITLTKNSGLTDREAQTILDFFNFYRAQLANGSISGQPSAADMTALEWDHGLAHKSQDWASKCDAGMYDNLEDAGQGQVYAEWSSGANGFVSYAMEEWVETGATGYDYQSNNYASGHSRYTQIMTSYSTKVGCGYDKCNGHPKSRLVCNFYIGGNLPDVRPYKSGPKCSKCPFGRPYCLKDTLCVRHDQTIKSNSNYECSIDFVKCSVHGDPQQNKCHCECHAGWTGASCDEQCTDKSDCSKISTNYCFAANKYITFMNRQCTLKCSLCKNIDMKPKVNTRGLTINVLTSKQAVLAGTTNIGVNSGDATDDRAETCLDNNDNCSYWTQIGECQRRPSYMLSFCRKSCNACGSCVNYNTDCRYWSSSGECTANTIFMGENCAKSCGSC